MKSVFLMVALDKEVLDEETALTVTIDNKNGYAEIDDGGTDGPVKHIFTWDGMKPVYQKTEPLKY